MEPLVVFITAFGAIALAEMGDKTQLLALVLGSRFKRMPVLLGLMAALSVLSLVAVLGGAVIFRYVPIVYVRGFAAVAFIAFAIWTFLEKDDDDKDDNIDEETDDRKSEEHNLKHGKEESCKKRKKKVPKGVLRIFAYVFLMIFAAEFGDKTQLATIVMASSLYEPFWIFLGAVTAFFVVDAPFVFLGKKIAEKVKVRYIKIASGILFLALGIYFLLNVLNYL